MKRILKRFRNDGETPLKSLIESKDPEIVYTVVDSIFYGIDNDLSSVECFIVEGDEKDVTFKMSSTEWIACLEKCLMDMIRYEDYEMCIKMKEYKEKIQTSM